MEHIDFTNAKHSLGRKYDGANGKKIGIIYNDEPYMLKFPVHPKSTNKEIDFSRYTNSCFSEYISCHIFNTVGIKAQETILGTYDDKVVVACKDFVPYGSQFNNFISIKNGVINSMNQGEGTELSSILEALDNQTDIPSNEVKEFFWDTFIMDAYVGNFDRHNGNWGFISNLKTGEFEIAPIFDCGGTLYPQASEEFIKKILNDEKEINDRIYVFPQSAIKQNGAKINYYNYLTTTTDKDCLKAIKKIVPIIKANKEAINEIIKNTPYLSDIKKEFYKTMLEARFEKILVPALEWAKTFEKNKSVSVSISKPKEKGGLER